MRKQQPVTQTLNVSETRKQFSTLVNKVTRGEARVLVEKSGAPVAAIVSADDLHWLEEWDAQRERDFAILEEVGNAFKDVPAEEIEREVAKALAEVRAEMRAEREQ